MSEEEKQEITEYNKSVPQINYNAEQVKLIRNKFAPGTTEEEFGLFLYVSKKYNLDILTKELWCVKYTGYPAQIYAGRDGFLKIAHCEFTEDGKKAFDGMNTVVEEVERPLEIQYYDKKNSKWSTFKSSTQFVATTTVKRKDVSEPFSITVWEEEYSTGRDLWVTKRRTMIQKVAESQCLRRAFCISGIYAPEEMSQWEEETKVKIDNKTTRSEAEKIPVSKVEAKVIEPKITETEPEKYKPTFKSNKDYWASYNWDSVNPDEKPPSRGYDKIKKKPKPSLEALKIWFYTLEYMEEKQAQEFMKNVTGKEHSWDYTYGDIRNIVTALEGLESNGEELDSEEEDAFVREVNYEQNKL